MLENSFYVHMPSNIVVASCEDLQTVIRQFEPDASLHWKQAVCDQIYEALAPIDEDFMTADGWSSDECRVHFEGIVQILTVFSRKSDGKIDKEIVRYGNFLNLANQLQDVCFGVASVEARKKLCFLFSDVFFADQSANVNFGYTAIMLVISNIRSQADVKMMYKLRIGLQYINDIEAKGLLAQRIATCFTFGQILRVDEGRRFLAFALSSVHPLVSQAAMRLMRESLLRIKNESTLLAHMATVLHAGWLASSGEIHAVMEPLLFELAEMAVKCEPLYAARVREWLKHFLRDESDETKSFREVLSAVVLGNMSVANWKVRFNAITLLALCFPMVGPDAEDYHDLLAHERNLLMAMCLDKHPEVRRTAVIGLGRVANGYWEVLDTTALETQKVVEQILNAARDKTSAAVRVAAIQSVGIMLNNPLTHSLFLGEAMLLDQLTPLFNDKSAAVRRAFIELAVTVDTVKGRARSLISEKDLMSRLVKDHIISDLERLSAVTAMPALTGKRSGSARSVADAVAQFLFKKTNFASLTPPRQVSTLLEFVTVNPQGAIILGAYVYRTLGLANSLKLLNALFLIFLRHSSRFAVATDTPEGDVDQALKGLAESTATLSKETEWTFGAAMLETSKYLLRSLRADGAGVSRAKKNLIGGLIRKTQKSPTAGGKGAERLADIFKDEYLVEVLTDPTRAAFVNPLLRLMLELDICEASEYKCIFPATHKALVKAFGSLVAGRNKCSSATLLAVCTMWEAAPVSHLTGIRAWTTWLGAALSGCQKKRQKTGRESKYSAEFTKSDYRELLRDISYLDNCWRIEALAARTAADASVRSLTRDVFLMFDRAFASPFFLSPRAPSSGDPLLSLGSEFNVVALVFRFLTRLQLKRQAEPHLDVIEEDENTVRADEHLYLGHI